MTKKLRKIAVLAIACVMVSGMTVSASAWTAAHGNDNANYKVYARMEESSPAYLGAQITYQLDGAGKIVSCDLKEGLTMSITSSSGSLKGKSGWSYGYYYVDRSQVHQSTERMNFSF